MMFPCRIDIVKDAMFIAMVYWLWRWWGRKNIDFDNRKSRSSKFYCGILGDKSEFGNLIKKEQDRGGRPRHSKKMSLPGLWCIQYNASRSPSMSKVIQMLGGDIYITTLSFLLPIDTPLQLYDSDQMLWKPK